MRKLLVCVLFCIGLFSSAYGLHACEMRYTLLKPEGNELDISPGDHEYLTTGEGYTLKVVFVQDHRK